EIPSSAWRCLREAERTADRHVSADRMPALILGEQNRGLRGLQVHLVSKAQTQSRCSSVREPCHKSASVSAPSGATQGPDPPDGRGPMRWASSFAHRDNPWLFTSREENASWPPWTPPPVTRAPPTRRCPRCRKSPFRCGTWSPPIGGTTSTVGPVRCFTTVP